jgi:hypothetical protein
VNLIVGVRPFSISLIRVPENPKTESKVINPIVLPGKFENLAEDITGHVLPPRAQLVARRRASAVDPKTPSVYVFEGQLIEAAVRKF